MVDYAVPVWYEKLVVGWFGWVKDKHVSRVWTHKRRLVRAEQES